MLFRSSFSVKRASFFSKAPALKTSPQRAVKSMMVRFIVKKRQADKPNSVPLRASVIYLMQPTPRLGRAALRRRYIWPCSPPVRTPRTSPHPVVGSCPTFSPLPAPDQVRAKPAVVFCYALHKLSPICAFHREALCAVRTVLTARRRRDRKACRTQRYKKNGLSGYFSYICSP